MVKGIRRYVELARHVSNPGEYYFHKGARRRRDLVFYTRPHAIRLEVPSRLYLLFKEIFMEDVYGIRELVSSLPPCPKIIDIGANAGFFNVILLSKTGQADILAFEPIPANVMRFQYLLERNPWLKPFIRLDPRAVTGQPVEMLTLYAEDGEVSQTVASVFADFHENNTRKIEVPSLSLTEILENEESVDMLKLDCEGSEYDILYHTSPVLIRRIGRILAEVHDLDTNRRNVQEMSRFLTSAGFRVATEWLQPRCYMLTAVRE